MAPGEDPVTLRFALLYQVAAWYPWVVLTPLVLSVGRRFSLEQSRLWVALPIHLAAAIVIGASHLALALAGMRALATGPLERSFWTAYADWMLPTRDPAVLPRRYILILQDGTEIRLSRAGRQAFEEALGQTLWGGDAYGTELRLSRSRREHLQTRLQQTF